MEVTNYVFICMHTCFFWVLVLWGYSAVNIVMLVYFIIILIILALVLHILYSATSNCRLATVHVTKYSKLDQTYRLIPECKLEICIILFLMNWDMDLIYFFYHLFFIISRQNPWKKNWSCATNLRSHELAAIIHISFGIMQSKRDCWTPLE